MLSLIRKFYEAKRDDKPYVTLFGTGKAVREWTYVEDAAEGIIKAMEIYNDEGLLNIAVGEGYTIKELADIIKEIVGYEGEMKFDATKPDGALYKIADITKMKNKLNWQPKTTLRNGIKKTLDWFVDNYKEAIKK